MKKSKMIFNHPQLTKEQMKNILGGETKPSCIFGCSNGPGDVLDHCPDDSDDPEPCFEGGYVTDCACFYN